MTEKLTSCVSVSLAYDCASVITMETFLQLTESHVRDLVLCPFGELPKCVAPSPDKNYKHIFNVWSLS